MRGTLARRGVGGDRDGFRWRGEDVWRVEGFSDAVFAFAVTLLVVSLEVPRTFDELLVDMRGFLAFAICFFLLLSVWHDHYKFFRRYGLRDTPTLMLNSVLLFLVLLYVYPLKFLFTLVTDQIFGFGRAGTMIEVSQGPLLMVIYGAGFIAVQVVFILMYLRAYSLRHALGLDARELLATRKETQSFLLNVLVGLISIVIAVLGGPGTLSWAGWAYVLIAPLQTVNGHVMGSRIRREAGSGE